MRWPFRKRSEGLTGSKSHVSNVALLLQTVTDRHPTWDDSNTTRIAYEESLDPLGGEAIEILLSEHCKVCRKVLGEHRYKPGEGFTCPKA